MDKPDNICCFCSLPGIFVDSPTKKEHPDCSECSKVRYLFDIVLYFKAKNLIECYVFFSAQERFDIAVLCENIICFARTS